MNDKREAIIDEVPRHRKKSKKKGMPRADHKHVYKTVLLCRYIDNPIHPGERNTISTATKVCTICGRIGDTDHTQYEVVDFNDAPCPYPMKKRQIRDKDKLEKWHCQSFFDKIAYRMTENDIREFEECENFN